MKTTNRIKTMLLGQGVAKVVYLHDVNVAVKRVVSAWTKFCAQSVNHKELIPFENNGGYENKDRRVDSTSRDHKEDFHITRSYELPTSFNPRQADIELINSGKEFFEAIRPTLIEIAYILSEITGIDFVDLAVKQEDGWVLRLLHYYPGNMDKEPAHYHPDKGGHTLHLYDSTPGFEKFWKNEWTPLRFTENEMVFFMGLLGQLHSQCMLNALSHRVVSTPEIIKNGRISLVMFNDYPTSPFTYDKETYGPSQLAFKPGENYKMPIEIFQKYFKTRIFQDAR